MTEASSQSGIPNATAADVIPGFADFLAKLTEAFADLPPQPIFAQSTLFPNDGAWQFTIDRQEYVCAGPRVWAQIPHVRAADQPFRGVAVLGGIEVHDLDAAANERMRRKVFTALASAMSARQGQDPAEGLGAKPASATAEGRDAQPLASGDS